MKTFMSSRASALLLAAGLALSLASPVNANPIGPGPELFVNGGFNDGTLNGWSLSLNTGFTGVVANGDPFFAYEGGYSFVSGPIGSEGVLSQFVNTNIGEEYILRFYWKNYGDGPGNSFLVAWNNMPLFGFGLPGVDLPASEYQLATFHVTGGGPNTLFEVHSRNDGFWWGFDGASLQSTTGGTNPVPDGGSTFGLLAAALGVAFLVRHRHALGMA